MSHELIDVEKDEDEVIGLDELVMFEVALVNDWADDEETLDDAVVAIFGNWVPIWVSARFKGAVVVRTFELKRIDGATYEYPFFFVK